MDKREKSKLWPTIHKAKNVAIGLLREYGIFDDVKLVMKHFRMRKNCIILGEYIKFSQFAGRPEIKISGNERDWLKIIESAELRGMTIQEAIIGTVLHEYGHIICEWVHYFGKPMRQLFIENWAGEEDFCQGLTLFITQRKERKYKFQALSTPFYTPLATITGNVIKREIKSEDIDQIDLAYAKILSFYAENAFKEKGIRWRLNVTYANE